MGFARRKLPVAPLLVLWRGQTDAMVAELVGTSTRTVVRWRAAGEIPWTWADRICTAYDVHPRQVWGSLWEQEIVDWPGEADKKFDRAMEKNDPES